MSTTTPGKAFYLDATKIEIVDPEGRVIKINRSEWRVLMKFALTAPGQTLCEQDFVGIIPLRSLAVMMNALRSKLGRDAIICERASGYSINSHRISLVPVWEVPQKVSTN